MILPKFRDCGIRIAFARRVRHLYGATKLLGAPREVDCLRQARPGTTLRALITRSGYISSLAAQPFVCATWSSASRLRRMIDHCAIVDKIGHPFNVGGDQFVEIIAFDLDGERCRLTLDQPNWLLCDGLLSVCLWVGVDRIFSITFCLSDEGGERTAYIGGLQGRRHSGAMDQNRALTKAAHGMRPRDLAFDLFRMLLPYLKVTQLKCVANANRYQMTKRALLTIGTKDQVLLDYDDICTSRGGVLDGDGFFALPVERADREVAEIPARKRSMYARRYALLRQLMADIAAAFKTDLPIQQHRMPA